MAKYKKEFVDQLPMKMQNGEAVEEVCADWDISKETFFQWVKHKPEFAEAYSRARMKSVAWWIRLGKDGAIGNKQVNPAIWIFNMRNRAGWTDKVETEITSLPPIQINFPVDDSDPNNPAD